MTKTARYFSPFQMKPTPVDNEDIYFHWSTLISAQLSSYIATMLHLMLTLQNGGKTTRMSYQFGLSHAKASAAAELVLRARCSLSQHWVHCITSTWKRTSGDTGHLFMCSTGIWIEPMRFEHDVILAANCLKLPRIQMRKVALCWFGECCDTGGDQCKLVKKFVNIIISQ